MYARIIVELAAWLFVGLATDNIADIVGVVDCAGALQVDFAVLIV